MEPSKETEERRGLQSPAVLVLFGTRGEGFSDLRRPRVRSAVPQIGDDDRAGERRGSSVSAEYRRSFRIFVKDRSVNSDSIIVTLPRIVLQFESYGVIMSAKTYSLVTLA